MNETFGSLSQIPKQAGGGRWKPITVVRLPEKYSRDDLTRWGDWLLKLGFNPADVPITGSIIIDPNRRSVTVRIFARHNGRIFRVGNELVMRHVEKYQMDWPPPSPPFD